MAMVETKKAGERLNTMGYGIISFIDMHLTLILMMVIIICIQIPIMYIFKNFEYGNTTGSGLIHSLSIGNLGFAEPLCKDTNLGSGLLDLKCDTGMISEVVDFGITPDNAINLDPCKNNFETRECTDKLPYNQTLAYIEDKCLGRHQCLVNITFDSEHKNNLDLGRGEHKCTNGYAQFFV